MYELNGKIKFKLIRDKTKSLNLIFTSARES